MIVCQEGHIHTVSMLMDNGAHVNLQNKVPKKTCKRACMHIPIWCCDTVILFHHAEGCLSLNDCLQ